MKRRMLGIVASLVLATFGTVVLVGYVQSAHDRAAAGEPTAAVVVATKAIARGTKAAELEGLVKTKHVPVSAKAEGAVAGLAELAGQVAATDLLPGEQLLTARFAAAETLGRKGVPPGLLEVTVQLDPARALGGALKPGDTVAVVASFGPFDPEAAGIAEDPAAKRTPNTTKVILNKVLVTNVQTSDAKVIAQASKSDDSKEDNAAAPKPSPSGEFLVTLALDAASVERVVFAAEYGALWLSAEPADAPVASNVQSRGAIYR